MGWRRYDWWSLPISLPGQCLGRAAGHHSLAQRPTRPGELAETLLVCIDHDSWRLSARHAAERRVPSGLMVALGIEAQRCGESISAATGEEPEVVRRLLDEEARRCGQLAALPSTALGRYAAALLGQSGDEAPRTVYRSDGLVELTVPVRTAAAWRAAAALAGKAPELWAASRARLARSTAVDWEAAAAFKGNDG